MSDNPWGYGLKWGFAVFLFVLAFFHLSIWTSVSIFQDEVSPLVFTKVLLAIFILALEWGSLFFFLPSALNWFFGSSKGYSFAIFLRSILFVILLLAYAFVLPFWSIPLLVK